VLFVLAALAAVLTVPLFGGDITRLAQIRFRHAWLLPCGVGVQFVTMAAWTSGPLWAHRLLHVASYGCVFAFLALNRRLRGMWVVATGALLNFVAIVANGGVMPASAAAVRTAGLSAADPKTANSMVVDGARLLPLGDVFALPHWLPVANVFSVGDVVIAVGTFVVVTLACRRAVERETGENPGNVESVTLPQ
jgi:hypothetical protein